MLETRDELLRKIRLGEDSVLELKRVEFGGDKVAAPRRNDLADELAAMANTRDGVCVLGVDDKTHGIDGIPIGKLDAVEAFVREICNDSIKPPLTVAIIRLELPDVSGDLRAVVRVDVPRSLFVHQSPGGYFRRQGSSKRQLEPDQLARLFQHRSQARLIRFEEQTVPRTGVATLDEPLWRRFTSVDSADPVLTLRKLKLISGDDNGVERATVAGVLMCAAHPEEWLPHAYIEAVRYRGIRQDSNYQMDAAQIVGPLDEQVRWAVKFVRRNMTVAATKMPAREETPQFSERAVFEAIVNAAAHRDYSVYGCRIRLFMFDDRLELYSPGCLLNTITVDSLPYRQASRNELITSLLSRCPVGYDEDRVGRRFFMERRGDGVPIIMEESRVLSGRLPEYRLIDDAELLLAIYSAKLPNHS